MLASALPLHHGMQLAVDITLRSALTARGEACPNAAAVDGRDKRDEIRQGSRCQLVEDVGANVLDMPSQMVSHAFSILHPRVCKFPHPFGGFVPQGVL